MKKIKNKYRSKKAQWRDYCYKKRDDYSNDFLTYWNRPKYSRVIHYRKNSKSSSEVGIVLQGPLLLKDHFTLESVKLYKQLYPKCPVIVSTWKNENADELKKIRDAGGIVLLSDYPIVRGHERVNWQKKSSITGIRYAKEIRCKYVLKSRTDQRIYGNDVMNYFKSLIDFFPIKISSKANKRIICCSLSTISNRIYNISDMLLFGDIDDMILYFNPVDAEDRVPGWQIFDEKKEPVKYAQARPGEIYFATHYLENCGFTLKWTFEDSDYYRNQMFIVVDAEAIDLFWPKYTRKEYMWRSYTGLPFETVGFKDWFVAQFE